MGSGTLVCYLCFRYVNCYPVYWKGNSQSQSQGSIPLTGLSQSQSRLPYVHSQTTRQGKGRSCNVAGSDEDAGDPVPSNSKVALKQTTTNSAGIFRASHTSAKTQPLFFDSDEQDDESRSLNDGRADNDEDAATLQSSDPKSQEPSAPPLRPTLTRRTKKAPVIVDDDSDDGATFKGFRGKKRGFR